MNFAVIKYQDTELAHFCNVDYGNNWNIKFCFCVTAHVMLEFSYVLSLINNSLIFKNNLGLPWRSGGKESACQCRGHRFDPWIRKNSTSWGATKPMSHNYWACVPRACTLQQGKPLQWETFVPQLESSPWLPQLQKSLHSNEDPTQS